MELPREVRREIMIKFHWRCALSRGEAFLAHLLFPLALVLGPPEVFGLHVQVGSSS